jgi:hypothetical protein
MTPELKTACEVIFQEHKTSTQPIKWSKDTFRGRISIGLSEVARETLVKKNIIVQPNKANKVFTLLNPDVATATSFEEAEKIIVTKKPAIAMQLAYDPEAYINDHVYGFAATPRRYSHQLVATNENTETVTFTIEKSKWYLRPFFCYVVWPLCAIAAGALFTRLIAIIQKEFFFG